jgi:hypothetical protein
VYSAGAFVISRNRPTGTLFQQLPPAQPRTRDPVLEEQVAHAVEQWPLLALLTPGVARAATPRAEPEPKAAAKEPEAPAHARSPLDELFDRLKRAAETVAVSPPAAPLIEVEANDTVVPLPTRNMPRRTGEAPPAILFERAGR